MTVVVKNDSTERGVGEIWKVGLVTSSSEILRNAYS